MIKMSRKLYHKYEAGKRDMRKEIIEGSANDDRNSNRNHWINIKYDSLQTVERDRDLRLRMLTAKRPRGQPVPLANPNRTHSPYHGLIDISEISQLLNSSLSVQEVLAALEAVSTNKNSGMSSLHNRYVQNTLYLKHILLIHFIKI